MVNVFGNPAYREAFEQFRRIPDEIFEKYLSYLRLPNLTVGQLLDVGAGPGMQTEMLLLRLPTQWKVTALEPSVELGKIASDRLDKFGSRVSLIQCRFDQYFADGVFDVVWLSEVAHLLGNVDVWANHMSATMCPGGRVLIRTSTHTQLINRYWYQFFPLALQIDLARHPPEDSVLKALTDAGFSQVSVDTIDESRPIRVEVLLAMLRQRAFSTLHYLSDTDLDEGLHLLRSSLAGQTETKWHYEMTAYTATRLEGI